MSFLKLILKNPFRNKSRTFLAVIGIGIGIATIVALGAITAGLTTGIEDTLHAGGAELSILNKEFATSGGTPYGTECLDEKWIDKIKNISGVKNAQGVYLATVPIDNSFGMVIGINISDEFNLSSVSMALTEGRMIKDDAKEVLLGKLTLEYYNKSIGDKITINGQEFLIVGVYESGTANIDSGIFASLDNVQKLMDDYGNISVIYVYLNNGVDANSVVEKINSSYGDNLTTATSMADIEMVASQLTIVNAASWGISLLAILIGGIGIINTMIMSVYERTREIGVLKAVGWKSKKVLGMILGESLVLTITAGIVGSIIGIIGAESMVYFNLFQGMVPVYTIGTFTQAFGVAIIVGLIGGFYPAWRASRLPPTESLRYE